MRILLLPGIWPPDVGGPATHGPDFARFLVGRGHQVRVVTMADDDVTDRPCAVETVSRRNPFPIRYSVLAARAAQFARQSDVVYVSATYAAAAAATVAARRPLVAKLVSDPAYERAYRYGLFRGTLEEFQSAGGAAVVGLRRARTLALSRARTIVVPSEYLARIARGFGVDPARVLVVPNPAPDVPPSRQEPRPGTFVYAGRLTRQKALGIAIDAVALVPGARLVVVGDGPERAMLENRALRAGLEGRIAFLGAQPRERVLEELGSAWASVLSSDWENLPHAAVESLAVGTPVVATSVGGVPEVVHDGANGLLVAPGSVDAFAEALQRLADDPALRARLAAAAPPSVAAFSRDRVYGELERLLGEAGGT
ncbi:MAG TPA: glycosyltransferase family 4 protein [Gaiellaceae bacterium]|nr:glycosyltransferase family 4 protein [Gaiellaceae bacterium]